LVYFSGTGQSVLRKFIELQIQNIDSYSFNYFVSIRMSEILNT